MVFQELCLMDDWVDPLSNTHQMLYGVYKKKHYILDNPPTIDFGHDYWVPTLLDIFSKIWRPIWIRNCISFKMRHDQQFYSKIN